jgi:transcriptional regulator with XRE-family HTH domain
MTYRDAMVTTSLDAGALLREWRLRRRKSQLELAVDAEISQRHLSFLESGRSSPSREMVLHLAECLGMPLRERNQLLLAAGFAPAYGDRPLDDPALRGAAIAAVESVLHAHEPNPALAVDRHWHLVAANRAIGPFLDAVADPALLQPPLNVLRLSLHPNGLAPYIVNLREWRGHVLHRLRRQIETYADAALADLERELAAYPVAGDSAPPPRRLPDPQIAIPLQFRYGEQVLSFIGTITIFGTALEVTLAELAVETFFAADELTRSVLREVVGPV